MANTSHSDIPQMNVDLWRFSQYLRIAHVMTYLLLPDELIINSPKKYLFSFLGGAYRPRDAIRHIVWHLACSLYTRALLDKSFFLAGHKHLDICNDRKKVIDLLHNVENFDSSYFVCINIGCREHRKFRQVAYRTVFAYFELDLSTLLHKRSYAETEFFYNFSLPKFLQAYLNEEIQKDKRMKFIGDSFNMLPSGLFEEAHSPRTLGSIAEGHFGKFVANTVTGKGNIDDASILYQNLTSPVMLEKIEIRSDKDFINDIRRAKTSIVENARKKRKTILDNIFDGFKIYAGKIRDLLTSPPLTGAANLASLLAFFGLSAAVLAKLVRSIASKKPEDIIHIKISPDGEAIYIMSEGEILLELHESMELLLILAAMMKSLTENERLDN